MMVTIDGGAGSGKSYAAAATADALGWTLVHTGSLYRLMAYCFRSRGLEAEESEQLRACMAEMRDRIVLAEGVFRLDGVAVPPEMLNREENGLAAAIYAQLPGVRDFATGVFRCAVGQSDTVVEGRDCGTVVFPRAEFKFFFVNDNHERQKIRVEEGGRTDGRIGAILRRNALDSERAIGALQPADDAVIIHIDGFPSLQEAYRTILQIVKGQE